MMLSSQKKFSEQEAILHAMEEDLCRKVATVSELMAQVAETSDSMQSRMERAETEYGRIVTSVNVLEDAQKLISDTMSQIAAEASIQSMLASVEAAHQPFLGVACGHGGQCTSQALDSSSGSSRGGG
eukprot:Rmarinus@m.17689